VPIAVCAVTSASPIHTHTHTHTHTLSLSLSLSLSLPLSASSCAINNCQSATPVFTLSFLPILLNSRTDYLSAINHPQASKPIPALPPPRSTTSVPTKPSVCAMHSHPTNAHFWEPSGPSKSRNQKPETTLDTPAQLCSFHLLTSYNRIRLYHQPVAPIQFRLTLGPTPHPTSSFRVSSA